MDFHRLFLFRAEELSKQQFNGVSFQWIPLILTPKMWKTWNKYVVQYNVKDCFIWGWLSWYRAFFNKARHQILQAEWIHLHPYPSQWTYKDLAYFFSDRSWNDDFALVYPDNFSYQCLVFQRGTFTEAHAYQTPRPIVLLTRAGAESSLFSRKSIPSLNEITPSSSRSTALNRRCERSSVGFTYFI